VPQAEAAVTQVGFGFGSVLDYADGINGSTTVGSYGNIRAMAVSPYVKLGEYDIRQGGVYESGTNGPLRGTASFFANGTVIGAGGNGNLGSGYFQREDGFTGMDITTDQINKNIGFMTTTHNWGWANVSWNATTKALTINSVYVQSASNTSITVGDTGISAAPEPSRALLALAGLGAVALRRRRKQVAL